MTAIVKFGSIGDKEYRRDLLATGVARIVIGKRTQDRKIDVNYNFELPIAGRSIVGALTFNHDYTNVEVDNEYMYMEPLIEGWSFGGEINGNDIVLVVNTNGMSENPVLVYSLTKVGI